MASERRVWAALVAVWVIWGSTYLAIRWTVETIPPFLSAGVRHLVVGSILYAVMRLRGEAAPDRRAWGVAAVVGTALLFGGNGLVSWAEQRVPSGLTALIIAVVPVEIVLFAWLWPRRTDAVPRPSPAIFAGLALGVAGVLVLAGPSTILGAGGADLVGAAVLVLATTSWAAGSVWSRRHAVSVSPFLLVGMQSLAGGVACIAAGLATGEASQVDAADFTPRAVGSLAYLVVFGSLVAYTCYVWLLQHAPPARVATYGFVNPVVAVALGWLLAGETLSWRVALAAGLILAAVLLVLRAPSPSGPVKAVPAEEAA
ncbi:MAG TPA: EamA family transporter [Candidatus Thermoplasmatota archaeon]|nr:EamA family transporter [Candidatus Thermoplasmatota archaeon]